MITIDLKILETDQKISSDIMKLIYQEVSKRFLRAQKVVGKPIQKMIEDNLKLEPEYSSLINGDLKVEFGIPDSSIVDTVIKVIVDKVDVMINTISVTPQGLRGGLEINFFADYAYDSVVENINAKVIDANSGFVIPWLRWLLLEGTSPLVKEYDVKYQSGAGRSGGGFMIRSDNDWSVPAKFAGSKSSNWLTRATEKITEQQIEEIIKRALAV